MCTYFICKINKLEYIINYILSYIDTKLMFMENVNLFFT